MPRLQRFVLLVYLEGWLVSFCVIVALGLFCKSKFFWWGIAYLEAKREKLGKREQLRSYRRYKCKAEGLPRKRKG